MLDSLLRILGKKPNDEIDEINGLRLSVYWLTFGHQYAIRNALVYLPQNDSRFLRFDRIDSQATPRRTIEIRKFG